MELCITCLLYTSFVVNDDSLSGTMAHNYYLYEYNGKLNILPWDYNLSFGGMSMGGGMAVSYTHLRELEMFEPLKEKIQTGMPVLATCAGVILLADHLSNDGHVYFGTMPVTVKRNAYGRQLGSFHTIREMKGIGQVPMTFIRAPYIEKCGEGAEVLAEVDGNIVAVKYKKQYGLAFHPELDEDDRIHEAFLNSVKKYAKKNSPNTWL